jgi:hypothetical protein
MRDIAKLTDRGFRYGGEWPVGAEMRTQLLDQIPSTPGVYAFVADNEVCYIGKANNLHNRLQRYTRPNSDGLNGTAIRVRKKVRQALKAGKKVSAYFITPDVRSVTWNDFSLNVVPGLEESLIREMLPEWNEYGTRDSAGEN